MDDMHVNSGPTRAERRQARMDGRNNPPNHAETQGDLDRLGIPDDICWGVGGRVHRFGAGVSVGTWAGRPAGTAGTGAVKFLFHVG